MRNETVMTYTGGRSLVKLLRYSDLCGDARVENAMTEVVLDPYRALSLIG